MDFFKYKKGMLIGLIVGILSIPLSLLGLGSIFGMIFYPLIIIPKFLTLFLLGQSMIGLVITSVIFYILIGILIQIIYGKLKKK